MDPSTPVIAVCDLFAICLLVFPPPSISLPFFLSFHVSNCILRFPTIYRCCRYIYTIEFTAISRVPISRDTHHRRKKHFQVGNQENLYDDTSEDRYKLCNAVWNSLLSASRGKDWRVGKARLIEAYSRREENRLAPLNWKTLFGLKIGLKLQLRKLTTRDDGFSLARGTRPRASSTSSHLPITRKKIELTRAIFETTSSLGTRQSRSLNWNQPRNQRHVNLVKEGPPPWTSFIHTRSHLTLEPISTVSIMSCIGIMRVTRAATRKCASKLVSNFTAISRNTWSGE